MRNLMKAQWMKTSIAVLVLIAALGSSSVMAQDRTNEARSLYDAGAIAFEDGRFQDALGRWVESYELSGLAALLYNIGTAHDRLGHAEQAIEAYESYLQEMPDAGNANYTRARVEVLRSQLPEEGESQGVAEVGPSVSEEVAAESPAVPTEAEQGGPSAGAITLMSVGGVALVTGVVLAVIANGTYADLEEACAGNVCAPDQQDDIDRLGRQTLTADILMGAGAAVAVGGLVWLLVDGGEEAEDESTPIVSVGIDRVTIRGRF